jgi:hypothetical protein
MHDSHQHDGKTRLTEFEFTAGRALSTIAPLSLTSSMQELQPMFENLLPRVPLVADSPATAAALLSAAQGGR